LSYFEIVEPPVDPVFISHTKFLLGNVHGWVLASHEGEPLSKGYGDTGHLLKTYSVNDELPKNEHFSILNTFAEYLLKTTLNSSKLNFSELETIRVFWNYYNHASQGTMHIDSDQPNTYSLIFNLSDTGGTIVNDKTVASREGLGIIFNSDSLHKGLSPDFEQQRFCLNVIFKGIKY